MENPQFLLPICLACVAAVLPLLGYCYIRRVLNKEEEEDALRDDRGKYDKKVPDLTEMVMGGTESMETDDGIQNGILPTDSNGCDVEAQQELRLVRSASTATSKSRQVGGMSRGSKSYSSTKSPNDDISTLSVSIGSSQVIRAPRLTKGKGCSVDNSYSSSHKSRSKVSQSHKEGRKREKKQPKAEVDVHSCNSESCELCRYREQRKQQVAFVAAQPLDSKMVQKLKHAPESAASWWEMGDSFYELYQQAQQRAATSFEQYYHGSGLSKQYQ